MQATDQSLEGSGLGNQTPIKEAGYGSLVDLFADPERWCKYHNYLGANGRPCDLHENHACRACLYGGMFCIYPRRGCAANGLTWEAVDLKIQDVILKKHPEGIWITNDAFNNKLVLLSQFNDSNDYDTVYSVIQEAGV